MSLVVWILAPFVLAGSALAALTALGAGRRGLHGARSVVAGLAFPVTWVVWYVHDRRACRTRAA